MGMGQMDIGWETEQMQGWIEKCDWWRFSVLIQSNIVERKTKYVQRYCFPKCFPNRIQARLRVRDARSSGRADLNGVRGCCCPRGCIANVLGPRLLRFRDFAWLSLCLIIINFAIHAGGPVSRTGFREDTRIIPDSWILNPSSPAMIAAHTEGIRRQQRKNAEINETSNMTTGNIQVPARRMDRTNSTAPAKQHV